MSQKPLISVVIPLHNKAPYVGGAIRSVLGQSMPSLEIVVVNDGSTDNGPQIVAGIRDSRLRVVHQNNQGVSGARNRGIAEARANLVAFLDADDEWKPCFLETIHHLMQAFPGCCAYATRYLISDGEELRPAAVPGLAGDFAGVLPDYFDVAAGGEPPINSSTVCARKWALHQIGGFPLGVHAGEDLITWARLAVCGGIAYTMDCQSIIRVQVKRFEPGRMVDAHDYVGAELVALLKVYPKGRSLRRYLALWHRMRASTFFRHGLQTKALRESSTSLYYNPFERRTYVLLSAAMIPYSSRLLPALPQRFRAANQ
jgi:glycosyltransferase involved in cell wall biosynthesis